MSDSSGQKIIACNGCHYKDIQIENLACEGCDDYCNYAPLEGDLNILQKYIILLLGANDAEPIPSFEHLEHMIFLCAKNDPELQEYLDNNTSSTTKTDIVKSSQLGFDIQDE